MGRHMGLSARYKRLNLWNKIFFWAAIATIVTLPLTVWQCAFGPTRSKQEEGISIDREILSQIQRIISNDSEKLLAKYPLGYALFVITRRAERHVVTPYPDNWVKTGLFLDWNSIKVVQVTAETVSITPPDIGNIQWYAFAFKIKRQAGSCFDVLRIRNQDKPDAERIIVTIEIVEDMGQRGLICLLGFRAGSEGRPFPGDEKVTFGAISEE